MLKPYDFQNIHVWHSHDYNHGVERDKFKHVFSEHSILSSEFIYVLLFSFVCVCVCSFAQFCCRCCLEPQNVGNAASKIIVGIAYMEVPWRVS